MRHCADVSNQAKYNFFMTFYCWQLHYVRGRGTVLRASLSQNVTPEDVQKAWGDVTDMSKAAHVDTITEATSSLMDVLGALESTDPNNNDSKFVKDTFTFNSKDLILYALGGMLSYKLRIMHIANPFFTFPVGATVKDNVDLKFLYENHPDFCGLPSYFVMPGLLLTMASELVSSSLKHTEVNLSQVLHGEQYLEIVDDLRNEGTLSTTGSVIDVIDKKSGAVVVTSCKILTYSHLILCFLYAQSRLLYMHLQVIATMRLAVSW